MRRPSLNEQMLIIGGIQGRAQDVFAGEGQRISVQHKPVDLEPLFQPYKGEVLTMDIQKIGLQPRPDVKRPGGFCFIRLWFSTKDNKTGWQDVDFLRELSIAKNPVYFLILGNKEAITHILAVDIDDLVPVKNALKAKFPDTECELTLNPFLKFGKTLQQISSEAYHFDFQDYYTHPAYWRRLSLNENLKSSPILPIYTTLSSLEEDELGFYQVVCKSTAYPWIRNILNLIDTEAEILKYGNINLSGWYYPGFGNKENRNKVNSPILAVAIRTGAFCRKEKIGGILNSLSLAFANFMFAGEKLRYLSKVDYNGLINNGVEVLKMVVSGVVYHSGNLFNTEETLGFFHFPTEEVLKNEAYRIDRIEGFKVPDRLKGEGLKLGYNDYTGKYTVIRQPENTRSNHTGIIGRIRKGKSVEMENMILDDIQNGHGVGVIDPHGFLVERVIRQIPEKDIERTVYFSLLDDEYIPCYNPLKSGKDVYKIVDDNVNRLKSLYPLNAWGHSIEDTLRHSIYAVTAADLPLAAVRILLAKNSEGEKLRRYILQFLNNKEEELFWIEDFRHLTSIERVSSKLTLFLQPERANRLFSQKENRIDFRHGIDNRMVFLADLRSGVIGNDLTNIMGSCLFSSFYDAGISRMDMVSDESLDSEIGTSFNLYVDELYRYPTKSLEHSLRELRKFNVRLILALQQKEYMNDDIKSALSNIGTWIVLSLGWDDAQTIFKEFYGKVEVNDFMRRATGDGYVKIDEDITNIKTYSPKKLKDKGFRDEIIQYSRKHYYTRISKDKCVDVILPKSTRSKKKEKAVYDEI